MSAAEIQHSLQRKALQHSLQRKAGSERACLSTYSLTIIKSTSVITLWRLPWTYLDKTFSLFLTPCEEIHHRLNNIQQLIFRGGFWSISVSHHRPVSHDCAESHLCSPVSSRTPGNPTAHRPGLPLSALSARETAGSPSEKRQQDKRHRHGAFLLCAWSCGSAMPPSG